jgi:hypothetical protein
MGGDGRGGSSGGASGEPKNLFFSEYVEGTGSYKALEIRGAAGTDLDGCELATYSNGAATPKTLVLGGALGMSGVYVLCSSAVGSVAGVACDRSTSLGFNGNDAVALACGGATLDVIGQIGVDPGKAWTGGDASTADQTLRRRCSVSHGDRNGADAFDPSLEWVSLPADTLDGLGDPTCG